MCIKLIYKDLQVKKFINRLLYLSILCIFMIIGISYDNKAYCQIKEVEPINDRKKLSDNFKVWLTKNENKTFEIIYKDRQILNLFTMINPVLINPKPAIPKPQNKLWAINARIFRYLDEISDIYNIVRTIGKSNLVKLLSNILPGNWACIGFLGNPTFYAVVISDVINEICLKMYYFTLGINPSRDRYIVQRFDQANRFVTVAEKRLMQNYIDIYNALYTNNQEMKLLNHFLLTGISTEVKQALYDLCSIKLGKISGRAGKALDEIARILAEATSTVNISTSTNTTTSVQNNITKEDKTNKELSDLYNLHENSMATDTMQNINNDRNNLKPEKDMFMIFDE